MSLKWGEDDESDWQQKVIKRQKRSWECARWLETVRSRRRQKQKAALRKCVQTTQPGPWPRMEAWGQIAAWARLRSGAGENSWLQARPSMEPFLTGALAASLFAAAANICTSHFVVGNDVELFCATVSLNVKIFIRQRAKPQWEAALPAPASLRWAPGAFEGLQTFRKRRGGRGGGRLRSLMRACVLD